ncbi:hypothetical protein CRG98_009615 [Punica granatum]|uniref:Protein kinase domain-containing protein n=1 Tax=Punica granatum TaxID=22663 RepID=A0A2I0KNG2_PUNGR|nr:hypothetical protein CRG98_009615 [Punica granatum]
MAAFNPRFEPIKGLGAGSYGVVCSAKDQKMKENVAIKRISNVFENPTTAVRTLREMKMLRQIRHFNVISLKHVMVLLGSYNYGQPIDVWSVGCIFAKLLGRKPIFPGTCFQKQLQRIISVLGTPKPAELDFIKSEKARRYIKLLPCTRGTPLSTLFPLADPLGLDLLAKMLVFDPRKRITAAEALKHPYLADVYNPSLDVPAQSQVKLDLEGVEHNTLRQLMWDELMCCHDRFAQRPTPIGRPAASRNGS